MRRMVELREETGVQRSLTERLVRSILQWAGHVERMADDRLPRRAAELREQGRRRRGRPMLRWEDCVKIDVRKSGEEEDWKKKTRDRGGWKRLSDEAVKKLRKHLTPDKGKRGRERSTKLVLRVQQIACIFVQVALNFFSYDDNIVHIVPIMYMLMNFYNINNMLF